MRRQLTAWFEHWRERHQTPLSFWLHAVGIPLTVSAVLLAGWQLWHDHWHLWWRPVALLIAGYGLQWLGHLHEGNDMGEVILLKRALRLPYIAISPRFDRGARTEEAGVRSGQHRARTAAPANVSLQQQ